MTNYPVVTIVTSMNNNTHNGTETFVSVKRMGNGEWSVMTTAGNFSITKEDANSYMVERMVGGFAGEYVGIYETRGEATEAIRTHVEMMMEGRS